MGRNKMYYKYFNEQTTGKQVKQILVDILKSVIYAFILTFILSFIIGFRPVYIIGDSMTPEIMKHDVILVKKVAADEIRVGDVITYTGGSSGETNTTHRIYGIVDGVYYTKDEPTVLQWKAEGKTFEDVKEKCEPISYSQVKGRYSNRLVIMGDIVEYLTINNGRKLNIASIIEVVLTITALSFIISIFKGSEVQYESRG